MRNDIQLKHDVEEELQWDLAVDASRSAVQAKDDVVTSFGGVDTLTDKHAAEEAIRRVAGVTTPVIHVGVRMPSDMKCPDGEIVQVISNALHWNTSVSPNAVQITVEGGTVILHGEVDQDLQRCAALDTMRKACDAKPVANAPTLCAVPGPAGLSDRIARALQCPATVGASCLNASAVDGMVTLCGPLRSLNECRAAHEAVWDTPGVHAVVDQMWIGS